MPNDTSSATLAAPGRYLRKSLSYDSFIQRFHRTSAPTQNVNHATSNLGTSSSMLSFGVKREQEQRVLVGPYLKPGHESRGTEVSLLADHAKGLGRSESLISIHEQYASRNGRRQSKQSLPDTEPSLVSQIIRSTSRACLRRASANSENVEGFQLAQSRQERGQGTSDANSSVRKRSVSLSIEVPAAKQSEPLNAGKVDATTLNHESDITLLVMGVVGCGKSVVIQQGFGLAQPKIYLAPPSIVGEPSFQYIHRTGRIRHNEDSSYCPLKIIELEVSADAVAPRPQGLPTIDGAIICYDSSNQASFRPVEGLFDAFRLETIPTVVLACKSDLPRQLNLDEAKAALQRYGVGIFEVTAAHEPGKDKIRRSLECLLDCIYRVRHDARSSIVSLHWDPPSPHLGSTTSLTLTKSLKRVRSKKEPLYDKPNLEHFTIQVNHGNVALENVPEHHIVDSEPQQQPGGEGDDILTFGIDLNVPDNQKNGKNGSMQWATLDILMDKLLYLAVSQDDPTYITHFLLTYRRFSDSETLVTAMRKKIAQLDDPCSDQMFACYAQMRICSLLEVWITDYPNDFAEQGTADALSNLIRSITPKLYLLHYGSKFLQFLRTLQIQLDPDSAWAQVNGSRDESNSLSNSQEDDLLDTEMSELEFAASSDYSSDNAKEQEPGYMSSPDQESSQPLLPSLGLSSGSTLDIRQVKSPSTSAKQCNKELVKLAQMVMESDPVEVAQEITRVGRSLFLEIEPRHWLYYTFDSGKKNFETESISAFNAMSNRLGDLVVSCILCHDKPRARARQIEKFIEIGLKLRALNNYSALRAFVAGINAATAHEDEALKHLKCKSSEQAKILQSWDLLFRHVRSHRAYRLALRNTRGARIPALEIHMSDLIRAHEGNANFDLADRTKIHWGKFNMIGRFIECIAQCQALCRLADDYDFPERQSVKEIFLKNSKIVASSR